MTAEQEAEEERIALASVDSSSPARRPFRDHYCSRFPCLLQIRFRRHFPDRHRLYQPASALPGSLHRRS